METIETKSCPKCKIVFYKTEENFYTCKSGKLTLCWKCHNESVKKKQSRNKELNEKIKYNKMWDKKYKEEKRRSTQIRNARKRNLKRDLTPLEWEEAKNYFENECCYCGIKETRLAQEHFIALSKGGDYTRNNIVPACTSCNSSKKDSDFFEWYPKQLFYNKNRERKILEYLKYSL